MKRIISLLLTLCLVITFVPVTWQTAWADSEDVAIVDETYTENSGETKSDDSKADPPTDQTIENDSADLSSEMIFQDEDETENSIPLPGQGSEAIQAEDSFTDSRANEAASEEETASDKSGQCGDDLTWSINEEGTLTISGTGEMWGFASGRIYESSAPWIKENFTKVIIEPGVTTIGDYAFTQCNSLTSIEITSGVTRIGNWAFGYCEGLTEINIPSGVTEIGENGFYNCGLKEVSIPDSVVSLGKGAFAICLDLETVHIGSGVTVIDSAFLNTALTSFDVSEENPALMDIDGVIFSKDQKELVLYPFARQGEYTIPDQTSAIGDYAFRACSGLTSVKIPDSVTSIGVNAFQGTSKLETAEIPDSVTSIGVAAFAGSSIKEAYIPDSVTDLGRSAFSSCKKLETVYVGSGVSELKGTFAYCEILKNVTLSEGLRTIGDYSFDHCYALEELIIPNGVYRFGKAVFDYDRALRRILFLGNPPTSFEADAFTGICAALYYDDTNAAWTKDSGTSRDIRKDYGGRICWAGFLTNPDIPERMWGPTRQTTAVSISQNTYANGTENVVIASGDNYPDALAGVPLAYMLDAPILLVRKSQPDKATLDEIRRLGAKNAYILGGTGAISDGVSNTLKGMGLNVERIDGANRFATATAVARKMDELRGGKPSAAIFVYSHNYPDALAISNVAAIAEIPILYIEGKGSLRNETKQYMDSCKNVDLSLILGGPALISSSAETSLKPYGEVARLYGADRYETCLMINRVFSDILDGDSVCLACGTNYPDALAGSVFSANCHAPMILVKPNSLIMSNRSYICNEKMPLNVFAFGGTGVLQQSVLDEAKRYSLVIFP